MGNYLAIDIEETVGHHFLGHLENDKLQIEEIYRFDCRCSEDEGEIYWDLTAIFDEIKAGIKKCNEIDKLPILIGIDTCQSDFILLDEENNVIGNTVAFHQKTNVIHKLSSIRDVHPDYLEKAKTLLMVPDYFNYRLTGIKLSEFTSAMTTHLVNQESSAWDDELISNLRYPRELFLEIRRPGTVLGTLNRMVTEEVGYDSIIILPATHAASSAIFALPPADFSEIYQYNITVPFLRSVSNEMEYSAAVIGNLLVQLIISHELKDVQAAQECVRNSFEIINNH